MLLPLNASTLSLSPPPLPPVTHPFTPRLALSSHPPHTPPHPSKVEFRRNIIMIVLATDLSKHFEITGNLKAMAEANQQKDAQEDPELIMKLVMKVRS